MSCGTGRGRRSGAPGRVRPGARGVPAPHPARGRSHERRRRHQCRVRDPGQFLQLVRTVRRGAAPGPGDQRGSVITADSRTDLEYLLLLVRAEQRGLPGRTRRRQSRRARRRRPSRLLRPLGRLPAACHPRARGRGGAADPRRPPRHPHTGRAEPGPPHRGGARTPGPGRDRTRPGRGPGRTPRRRPRYGSGPRVWPTFRVGPEKSKRKTTGHAASPPKDAVQVWRSAIIYVKVGDTPQLSFKGEGSHESK